MQIYEYSFRIGLLGMGAAATIVVFLVVNVAVTVYYRYVGRGGGI
jgi:ABC-type sugar transport system permease subunit